MNSLQELKAEEVMSHPVLSVTADMTLKEAADFLSENEISGAVVTDSEAAPVGVVSLLDIVAEIAGFERPSGEPGGFYRSPAPKFWGEDEDEEAAPGEDPAQAVDPLENTTVSEIMSPTLIGVPRGTPAGDVARMMRDRHIHRVFVMDGGQPVGVISSFDLLGMLAGAPSGS